MKPTKEEISLCKQVAEKYKKKESRGDWIVISHPKSMMSMRPTHYSNPPRTTEDVVLRNDSRHFDIPYKHEFPLWTISDCLEFLRKRCKDHVLLIHEEGMEEEEEWYLWFDEYKETQQWGKGKTPLEACLKVVLAVLKEE